MNHELYEEAIHSDVLSEKLISQLLESMEYSSISFINWSIDVFVLNAAIKSKMKSVEKSIRKKVFTLL